LAPALPLKKEKRASWGLAALLGLCFFLAARVGHVSEPPALPLRFTGFRFRFRTGRKNIQKSSRLDLHVPIYLLPLFYYFFSCWVRADCDSVTRGSSALMIHLVNLLVGVIFSVVLQDFRQESVV